MSDDQFVFVAVMEKNGERKRLVANHPMQCYNLSQQVRRLGKDGWRTVALDKGAITVDGKDYTRVEAWELMPE